MRMYQSIWKVSGVIRRPFGDRESFTVQYCRGPVIAGKGLYEYGPLAIMLLLPHSADTFLIQLFLMLLTLNTNDHSGLKIQICKREHILPNTVVQKAV